MSSPSLPGGGGENTDSDCDPDSNNGVACLCIFNYTVAFASIEFIAYIGCLGMFFFLSCKKKRKQDRKSYVLLFLFLLAFIIRLIFIVYAHSGP